MKIYCPHCSRASELKSVPLEGQNIVCPYCEQKFAYKITMSLSCIGAGNNLTKKVSKSVEPLAELSKTNENGSTRKVNSLLASSKKMTMSQNKNTDCSIEKKRLSFFSYLSWVEISGLIGIACLAIFGINSSEDSSVMFWCTLLFIGVIILAVFKVLKRKWELEKYLSYKEQLYKRYLRWREVAVREGLKAISVNVRLWEEEEAYMVFKKVKLFEERVTGTSGGFLGFRVSENIMIGGGDSDYVRKVDFISMGDFCVTNKRLIFVGDCASRSILWEDVVKSTGEEDFCDIWTDKNGRSQFIGVNGMICNDLFKMLNN